jgi:small subunit ribosomal protein S23
MGRYDFRPSRVRQTAQMLLQSRRLTQQPPWYQVMHDIPPSEILVRTQPVQHVEPARKGRQIRKPSRMFSPQRIGYEEDTLRRDFFGDHPWELARPRMILEEDGKDYQRWDWSVAHQTGRPVSGERYA